ncbi:MAG: substrate-binding domain-containing protein [Oscillospiraceae bacterium]|nr:substrate-binding domain-containing protein [Oscillospiraceae bacterium]
MYRPRSAASQFHRPRNVEISCTTNPTLTTVSQPKFQLGFTACELLIENPKAPKREIFFDTELVVRESSFRNINHL